jgi:hypothetical protein
MIHPRRDIKSRLSHTRQAALIIQTGWDPDGFRASFATWLFAYLDMSMLRTAVFLTAEDGFTLIFISKNEVSHDAVPFCKVAKLGFWNQYSTGIWVCHSTCG